MIRRSERIVRQEVNGTATTYRVTRIHVFGCCVWVNTREVEPLIDDASPLRRRTMPSSRPDDTAEFAPVKSP